jgi:hypothetical protein
MVLQIHQHFLGHPSGHVFQKYPLIGYYVLSRNSVYFRLLDAGHKRGLKIFKRNNYSLAVLMESC